jgi:GNAT superfamily N-acetyltransferase
MIKVKQYTGKLENLLNWELDLEFWNDAQEIIRESLPYPYELETTKVYFAYAGSRIIGFIIGGDDGDERDECWRIAVDPNYRGQGIATELVNVSGLDNPRDIENTTEAKGFWASLGCKSPRRNLLVTV